VNRRLSLLLGSSLAFWGLTAVPAALVWGAAMYVFSAVAAGLCLLPTVAVLLWAERALGNLSPQLIMLGGTGLRMAAALGAGGALYLGVPYFAEQGPLAFWGWLLVYYLWTLALEVAVLLNGPMPQRAGPPGIDHRMNG